MIKARKDIPSGTIVLNCPERCNALSRRSIEQLLQAFDDFHQERRVRALILTGAGDHFCSGTDLVEIRESMDDQNATSRWYEDATQYSELIDVMLRFPKPIIVAVNGPVYGSGVGLVLASDLVIASNTCQLGLPEPRRGLVACQVAPLLAFRVGASHASRLLLSGTTIDANEAHRIGIFHELISTDLVWARANEVAIECSRNAPESIQLTKKMLNETIGEQLSMFHSIGAANAATARTTDAAVEGVNAFLEKRDPNWI